MSADGTPYARKKIGLGALLFHDVAGDGHFRTVELQLNANYALKLTDDSTHTIRPGINIGLNHRQVNWDAFSFDSQYNGQQFDPSLPTNEQYFTNKKTNLSIGLGSIYEWNRAKRQKLTAGFAAFNLNHPNQGFYGQKVQRDIRLSLFARATYPLGLDWDLLPSVSFNIQGKYREMIFGSQVKYTLVNRLGDYKALYAGLFYRNRDAGYVSVGMDYQSWFVGLSYDFNFSKLVPASNARGGFEVAIRYILFRFKPSKSVHRICPDYI
jgi:type IX secretion system PorP/SprF family membrane protein